MGYPFEIKSNQQTNKKPATFLLFFVTLRLLSTFPNPTLILTMKMGTPYAYSHPYVNLAPQST